MIKTMKPFCRGFGIFVILVVPSYLAVTLISEISKALGVFLLNIPYIAVFVSGAVISYFSQSNKITIPCMFGIFAAVFLGLMNYVGTAIGLPSDSIGTLWIISLTLPLMVFLSAIGAISMTMYQNTRNKS